ncbi:MAG: patatin-like phospholipase family protein [Steroidobacteraceae bacterium]
MTRPQPSCHPVRDAIFLDIPYIIDSVCRHGDYWLNGTQRYAVNEGGGDIPTPRPYLARPRFWLFIVLLLFATYGATLSALCGVFGAPGFEAMRHAAGTLCIGLAGVQFLASLIYIHFRIGRRFRKQGIEEIGTRLRSKPEHSGAVLDAGRLVTVYIVFAIVLFAWALPWYFFGRSLWNDAAFDTCRAETPVEPAVQQLVLFLVSAGLAALALWKARSTVQRIALQAAILLLAVVVLWFLADSPAYSEAEQVPYHHLYAVIAAGFALTALASTALVWIPFRSVDDTERERVRRALTQRELFPQSRDDPPLSPRRIFGGFVIGALQKPMQFLLLPAFAVILVPSGFIWHACLVGTLASALLVIASNLTRRWDQMSAYLRRYFLLGTPFIVSAAVIIVAISRLADVQYVTTVLNVAPFGVLFVWMIMAYVLGWWFESQVNSVLAARLLEVLGANGRSDDEYVPYVPGPRFEVTKTRVEPHDRYLAGHATGQFMTLGWLCENETKQPLRAFNAFAFIELFDLLLGDSDPETAHEFGRRIQLYFALVNVMLAIGFGALLWYHGRGDRTNTVEPVITVHQESAQGAVALASLLQATPAQSSPAIIVAASGGGTRAALYTATVLQGLHALHADDNVVLLSGVSGGGVAAAYFYAHRDALLKNKPVQCDALNAKPGDPWTCYLTSMTLPFIRDVLHGAGEWRIQSREPLGVLLAESFERRLFGERRLGQDASVGLILNTTITGHPLDDAPTLQNAVIPTPGRRDEPCRALEHPVSALGGGRLAFTNLRETDAFAKRNAAAPNIQLPFVLVRDSQVALAPAAALNANFPPVFPNARVNLRESAAHSSGCTMRSYYVTDGGATENLGLLSALMALQSSLQTMPSGTRLRNIEIVLAEASATGYDYAPDRGVGAATGQAKERLTGRLTLELLEDVQRTAHSIDSQASIRIHDLSMPRVFRSRGGFGTHWMFPQAVRVTNPLAMPLPQPWIQTVAQFSRLDRYWVTLSKEQLFELWQDLYRPSDDFCARARPIDPYEDLQTVSNWICGRSADGQIQVAPDPQPRRWRELQEALGKTD